MLRSGDSVTSNLRWLYERFRTASKAALIAPKGKPGEWMELHAHTPEAGFVGEAAGNMPTDSTSALILALKQLEGGVALNALVGVTSDLEVRLGHFRNGTSKTIYIRFFLAAPGKKQGRKGMTRAEFPASHSNVQTELFGPDPGATNPESVSSSGGVRRTESTAGTENRPDGLHLENSHFSDVEPVYFDEEKATDGQSVPAFDHLIDVEDFERFLAEGGAEEDSEIGRFVKEAVEEARAMIEADETPDFAEIARSMRATLDLAHGPPAVVDVEAPEPQDWHNAAGQVGEFTMSICQKYRREKGKLAILCPSPSGGKPLHEDTLVTMGDGSLRPIKELVVGDLVVSGAGRITSVSAVYDQGPLDVLKVTTRSGRAVIAESTHRFLTQRGWVEAGSLRQYDRRGSGSTLGENGEKLGRGDALQLGHGMERQPTSTMSEVEARFLGYMTGDGGATQPRSLRFSNIDPHVLAKFFRTCETLGMWVRQLNRADWQIGYADRVDLSALSADEKHQRRLAMAKAAYRQRKVTQSHKKAVHHPGRLLLQEHGIIGKKSTEKRVPSAIFGATDRAIVEFIGAYFECDGTRRERPAGGTWRDGSGPPGASFSSTSRGLLADVQTLLGRLGIRTSLRLKNGTYKEKRHISWRLAVLDLGRFFDLIPIEGAKSGQSGASRRREPSGHLAPDPVMKIEPAGQARCLCITVADDDSFLANDFVTHNTHAMVEAARADRAAGKRVGYAVLSRGLIEEAKERLTGGSQRLVQLHVIEGRHAGNCVEFESVEQAAALGYAPGTQVCPKCDKYPSLYNPFSSLDRNLTCEYYASRLRALREIAHANRYQNTLVHPYPLILTTHAGMAIGTAMHARGQKTFRSQPSLWQFDTIFIDEDPTGALEQQLEIKEEQLVYKWLDPVSKRPDAHTQMTRVLRGMFTLARAERHVAWTSGFRDNIHARDHGSTYASNDLIGLLQRAARLLGYDLEEVLAQVENESSVKSPKRGELLSMSGEDAAERYPHRFLVTISQAIRHEINTRKNAPESGAGLDLAYRVHADLTLTPESDPQTSGTTVGAISLTIATPFIAPESNVIIGDAYASVEHYEALFRRYRLYNDVDIVNHRVQWPKSSLLIRIPTRCTSGDFPTDASFLQHCDQAILPLLGMEEGRRVLLYTHKQSRELLEGWLNEKARDIGIEEYKVEHWGSGRGKDIYRDFDTFIAATEYLPNIYGLVHEANMRVAQANPMTPRIYFWSPGEKRKAGASLTDAITGGDPTLANAFQRRAIDELAQAVHRIRPAKPRPCEFCGKLLGKDPRVCPSCKADQPYMRWQKRCWILGYHVPMSAELLAATSTAVLDEKTMELKRDGLDHWGRGARVKVHADLGLLSFVSDREIATAMGDVFRSVGCWSPAFCHLLMGVPLGDALSRVLGRVSEDSEWEAHGQPIREHVSIGSTIGSALKVVSNPFSEPHRLTDRIYTPTAAWKEDAVKIPQLPVYRSARRLFIDALSQVSRPPETWRVKRDWMPKTSPGYECIGDPRRLEAIIDYYGPNPPQVPF